MLNRPGVQPRFQEPFRVPAPPRAALALEPDPMAAGTPDLAGLDDVAWDTLPAFCLGGPKVPGIVRRLARATADDLDESVAEDIISILANSGSVRPATAAAVPFFAEIGRAQPDPTVRAYAVKWLLVFARAMLADLVWDADSAAVDGRDARAHGDSVAVWEAVGHQVPRLLATWSEQPPGIRLWLAVLAGMYPERSVPLRDDLDDLADLLAGTRDEAAVRIALALIDGHDAAAVELADVTTRWADCGVRPQWRDVPGLTDRIRAQYVLAYDDAWWDA